MSAEDVRAVFDTVETIAPEAARSHASGRSLVTVRASALMAKEFPPTEYVVEGYIAEGLTVLAGRPKLGKSWLALDLAIAIASGGAALGSVQVQQGSVLYLALEDNERRLKSRLSQRLQGQPVPEGLVFATHCPRLDRGGIEAISDWLDGADKPRLVIIDVFTKVRPEVWAGESPYEADYRALAPLKHLADAKGAAIVIVHHTRKLPAEDPFDTVVGTTGFTGAADTILVMATGVDGITLYGRGRDIEEINSALSFNKSTGQWTVEGNAADVRRSDERQAILDVLETASRPMPISEIASALREQSSNVKQLLHKMFHAGEVEKPKRGYYAYPGACTDGDLETDNHDNPITFPDASAVEGEPEDEEDW